MAAEGPMPEEPLSSAEGDRPVESRRAYESPLRRQQAAMTQERIVATAVEMVRAFPTWDWDGLTIRELARRAEVNESTIYRYFGNERRLRDTVMRRLLEEAGVDLDGLRLEDFGDVVGRMFDYLSAFPTATPTHEDPTFVGIDERRRGALVAAVSTAAATWTADESELAAAMLDMFWHVPTHERLMGTWNLDRERATRAARWAITLIETAIRDGNGPGGPNPATDGA
ncbi:TetR/AcrR family transcriptional regulator [Frankia sp. AgB1.9]|nr:TetR/AcrR family transcriptional regulator [Frankia sp. AgW1.1]MBL7548009.1 TetR/AcrR family transcriptional regulator [Frankia sp. AgB1.9]MBL7622734.1 TetR/AcrR family transcriptional regulator [Frankia sp. AgB1.8]